MGAICAQAGRYGLSINHSTYGQDDVSASVQLQSVLAKKKFKISLLTPFPGKSNDISSTLAHHLGDVEWTVGLIGYSDRAIDCLGLHLQTHKSRGVNLG